MKLAAVICARMSSQRYPGKALCSYDQNGTSNLQLIIERVKASRHEPKIIVSTSTNELDDEIAEFVQDYGNNVCLYRGDLDNVVQRFDRALKYYSDDAEWVWRVLVDSPLLDIGIADWRLDVLLRNKADVMTIVPPEPTYAAQASIWSREAWDYCAKHSSGSMLEHPGEFIYENLGMFKTIKELGPENVYYQDIRTELDTAEDLEFFKRVWKEFSGIVTTTELSGSPETKIEINQFTSCDTREVLRWLSTRPDIVKINQHVQIKSKSTHLHGHHRARHFICQECQNIVAYKINDALEITCQKCGTTRRFYP